ncbi:MAG: VTT domain-containing protein [Myxococcota bacterium]
MADDPFPRPAVAEAAATGGGRWVRPLVVVTLVVTAVVAWQLGLFDLLTIANMRRFATHTGRWGPVLFVVFFAVGEILAVPSVIFVVVAGLVWPLHIALPTAYVGAMTACGTVFAFGRVLLAGGWGASIRARLPESAKRYDRALAHRGIRTVAVLRFFTFMSPIMHYVLAASRVRFGPMMIGSAIGLAPGITALVIGGEQAMNHWNVVQPYLLGAVALFVVVRIVQRLRRRAGATPPPTT